MDTLTFCQLGDRNITTKNLNITTRNRNIDASVYIGLSVGRVLDPCLCLSRSTRPSCLAGWRLKIFAKDAIIHKNSGGKKSSGVETLAKITIFLEKWSTFVVQITYVKKKYFPQKICGVAIK